MRRRGAFLLTIALAVLVFSLLARCGTTLDVLFLNVGHGDAVLINYGYWECLIDTGFGKYWSDSSPRTAILDEYVEPPIEVFLLSHPDEDHYNGFLYLSNRYRFDEVWRSPDPADDKTGRAFLLNLGAVLPVQTLAWSPDIASLSAGGLVWEVLHPAASTTGDDDKESLVVKLTYGQVVFLFTGDIDTSAEAQIMGRFPNGMARDGCLVILKLPQHGAATEKLRDFVRWSAADVAVCSSDTTCGSAAASLGSLGIPLYVTCGSVGVRVRTDGSPKGTEISFIH